MITGGDLRQSRLDVGYKTFTISPCALPDLKKSFHFQTLSLLLIKYYPVHPRKIITITELKRQNIKTQIFMMNSMPTFCVLLILSYVGIEFLLKTLKKQ